MAIMECPLNPKGGDHFINHPVRLRRGRNLFLSPNDRRHSPPWLLPAIQQFDTTKRSADEVLLVLSAAS
jgi:hypothetical protein